MRGGIAGRSLQYDDRAVGYPAILDKCGEDAGPIFLHLCIGWISKDKIIGGGDTCPSRVRSATFTRYGEPPLDMWPGRENFCGGGCRQESLYAAANDSDPGSCLLYTSDAADDVYQV